MGVTKGHIEHPDYSREFVFYFLHDMKLLEDFQKDLDMTYVLKTSSDFIKENKEGGHKY